jgi:uncharacterized protein (TIGR02145 family)
MRTIINSSAYLLLGLLFSFLISCKKETPKTVPTITAKAVSDITANSATAGGEVTDDGGADVVSRGVCWSSAIATPTTADNKTTDGTGSGKFLSAITGLAPNTTYNLRAYATNSVGTAYYSEVPFKTLALAPVLTTADISSVTPISLVCGGNITNDGGSSVTARGVCWSTSQNPSITDDKTSDGTGTGIFTSSVSGLRPSTTFYLRAYATNSLGTTYGNQVTVKTLEGSLPTVISSEPTNITYSGAVVGGNVTNDGGLPILERGLTFMGYSGDNPPPGGKIILGKGKGTFSTNLILIYGQSCTYRAYAINSLGISHGNPTSFINILMGDADGNEYNTVSLFGQFWFLSNLKTTKYNDGTSIPLVADDLVWRNLSTPGYCWYNNDEASNKNEYGALYNWFTVNTGKLCPIGWHVASDEEWTTLSNNLLGEHSAGGILKELGTTHWQSPNYVLGNKSYFNALPGGYRVPGGGAVGNPTSGGNFAEKGQSGYWYTSTEYDNLFAHRRLLKYDSVEIFKWDAYPKTTGMSVRCIKNK